MTMITTTHRKNCSGSAGSVRPEGRPQSYPSDDLWCFLDVLGRALASGSALQVESARFPGLAQDHRDTDTALRKTCFHCLSTSQWKWFHRCNWPQRQRLTSQRNVVFKIWYWCVKFLQLQSLGRITQDLWLFSLLSFFEGIVNIIKQNVKLEMTETWFWLNIQIFMSLSIWHLDK